jgi:hypothetical protein
MNRISLRITKKNFEILNRGDEPTFVTRVRQEVIDITLTSTDIKREIYNWRVTTEVSLSDHRIIRFKIISDPRKPYEYRNPRCRSTDWELFSKELVCSMRGWDKDNVSTCKIDECAAKIQSSIIKAYEKLCPLKTASGVLNTPYWSSELGNLCATWLSTGRCTIALTVEYGG